MTRENRRATAEAAGPFEALDGQRMPIGDTPKSHRCTKPMNAP